jgi:hypothetical protein
MKKIRMSLLFCILLAAVSIKAQDIPGTTTMYYDPQSEMLIATCTSNPNYSVQQYYGVSVNCAIYQTANPYNIIANNWADGAGYVTLTVQGTPNPDTSYTAQGTFYTDMYYYYLDFPNPGYNYWDPYDFFYFNGAGIYVPWYYDFLGTNYPNWIPSFDSLFLGQTYAVIVIPPVPYAARLIETVSSSQLTATACGAGYAGWTRTVMLKIVGPTGQDLNHDGILMTEAVSIGTPNDLGINCNRTSCSGQMYTYSGGYFIDTFWFCSAVCPNSNGETDVTQVLFYNGIPVQTPNLNSYKCNGVLWNGQ